MATQAELVLIPSFTTLSGVDGSPTMFTTQPRDVSVLASANFQFVRGPIKTADPHRARCIVTLEESEDKTSWVVCKTEEGLLGPDGELVGTFPQSFRFQWLRARVELEGEAVTCSLKGEIQPRRTGASG